MKDYNKIKDAMIACLVSSHYYSACMTANNEHSTVIFATVCMFGCVYFMIREVNNHIAKKLKRRTEGGY